MLRLKLRIVWLIKYTCMLIFKVGQSVYRCGLQERSWSRRPSERAADVETLPASFSLSFSDDENLEDNVDDDEEDHYDGDIN